jgi:hypothetical protein
VGVSRLALALGTLVQLVQEHVANTNEIFAQLPIPHSEDLVPGAFKKPSSRLLAPHVRLEAMLQPANFDDEVPFETDEINNVRADRVLPAETKSA